MANNRKYYLIVDTETSLKGGLVCDFAAVVVDRHGTVYTQLACLVEGIYGKHELFHDAKAPDNSIWSLSSLAYRKNGYTNMLNNGERVLASVGHINQWLVQTLLQYPKIALTAFNLPFDDRACKASGIDLSIFTDRFCLWIGSLNNICKSRNYINFAINHHEINNRTDLGSMTVRTNAEVVSSYIKDEATITSEKHTALSDILDHELYILIAILKKSGWRKAMAASYNWRDWQIRDKVSAKCGKE